MSVVSGSLTRAVDVVEIGKLGLQTPLWVVAETAGCAAVDAAVARSLEQAVVVVVVAV